MYDVILTITEYETSKELFPGSDDTMEGIQGDKIMLLLSEVPIAKIIVQNLIKFFHNVKHF